jgi:hypothetical protein
MLVEIVVAVTDHAIPAFVANCIVTKIRWHPELAEITNLDRRT